MKDSILDAALFLRDRAAQLAAARAAARFVPGLTYPPIEGFIANRLDEIMKGYQPDTELLEMLREAYLRGMQDSGLTLAELAA